MTQRPARVEEESRGRMLGLILAANVSQAICTAVELGLPEALADGPQHVDDLAVGCHAHRGQLGRLMRVLASFGVLARGDDERFELTALGETLLGAEEDGRSLAGLAVFAGSRWLSDARGALTGSVRTGVSAFRCAHGADLYESIQEHADLADLYERWAGYSAGVDSLAEPVLASYDFSAARHVVDVGGRYGTLLARILDATPGLTGTLFDLPDAEAGARAQLRSHLADERCRVIAGSFFDQVPDGGDLYMLSNVLLDWDDDRAGAILSNCRRAMAPEAVLLTIEPVFTSAVLQSRGVSSYDLWMMVHSGAMRTLDELNELLAAAGFRVLRVLRTASGAATLIEATPA
jgi:O-methyltransferase domain